MRASPTLAKIVKKTGMGVRLLPILPDYTEFIAELVKREVLGRPDEGLSEAIREFKLVPAEGDLVRTAEALGMTLGR